MRIGLSGSIVVVGLLMCAGARAAETAPAADPRYGDLPHTNTVFQPTAYKTLPEWEPKRAWLRDQVRFAAGLFPEPPRTPLNAKISEPRTYGDFTVQKVSFESYPGFYVTGNLYRPAKAGGKLPGVACPHGHWSNGRTEQSELGNIPARCIMLARLGAVVFAYDMVGYNDSKRQIDHRINTPARDLWGITSLHLQTWNSVRVLDFLQSLPDVDPERIGVTGASGGGTQTFILYAIEDRLKAAAPVNMISSTMQGGCICENAPCLRIDTQNMEIGALMAPRPMLMVSATGDWTQLTPKVEYPFIRGIYELYGAADKVKNAHIDAPHNYNQASREAMYAFFARHLLGRSDADAIQEHDIPRIEAAELLTWSDETAPKNLLTIDQLTDQLTRGMRERIDALKPVSAEKQDQLRAVVRLGLTQAVGSPFPAPGEKSTGPATYAVLAGDDRKITRVERAGRTLRCVSLPGEGARRTLLQVRCLNSDGAPERLSLLCADVFDGKAAGPASPTGKPRGSTEFFTAFNRTDPAETAFDVITALAVALNAPGRVSFRATGDAGPAGLLARALVPDALARDKGLRTAIDLNGFKVDSDEAYLQQLNVPHIRRIGGLQAIAAVACNGPVWFHNVGEGFDEEWVRAAGKVNGVEVRVTRGKADEQELRRWLAQE